MSCLVIIPARGGSKGIPRKNIKLIDNKPLIAYTIDAALSARPLSSISKVIVSTDDPEIKSLSKSCGACVPFLRPSELAGDNSTSFEYVKHALEFYEDKSIHFDCVMILQPTSPLRWKCHIVEALQMFESHQAKSLISVYEESYINPKVCYDKCGNYGAPLNPDHNKGNRRQEDQPFFVRNGAIYITDVSYFKERSSLICDQPVLFEMPKSLSVNIDTMEDFLIAESLLKSSFGEFD